VSPREQAIAVYQQALMEAAEHPDPEIGRLVKRELAKKDLFFLLTVVLGRSDVNRDWVFERCREVGSRAEWLSRLMGS